MSPDLAAPQGLRDLVEAFARTAQAVLDLARSCSDDDLRQPTDCPGWTVHDQISHVVGVEAWLAGHRDPRVEMPPYEHLRNGLGRKVEYAVEVRRGRSGAEVANELEGVLAERLSALRDPALTDTSIIAGPFGPDQADTVLLLRTFDVWVHEQDIRGALGQAGNLDSPAAALCVSTVLLQLPRMIAKGAALEPGQSVVLEVTGPIAARTGFLVELDEQGRARGHTAEAGRLDPQVTISLSTEAFTRRAAGRRSVSDTRYEAVGDQAVASRVLEAMVVTH
jgi:uncharacterized protein (TIGR03083 family)